jgi:hypothetical protein
MTTRDEVLQAAADGLLFYDYYARRVVIQGEPGSVTHVASKIVEALEDDGLIEDGDRTGCDWQPTQAGLERLAGQQVAW